MCTSGRQRLKTKMKSGADHVCRQSWIINASC